MIVTLTKTDPDNTPITFLVDKIVLFTPAINSQSSRRESGWQEPKTRIFDVTDTEDSIGTGVIETYEFVKSLVEQALMNK